MSKWIRKNDKVVVVAGNDKGTVGAVLARKNDRILVKGVNVRKRHMKQRDEHSKSQILELERPVHISNVALSDDDGNPMKVRVVINETGDKELHSVAGKETKFLRTLKKKEKK